MHPIRRPPRRGFGEQPATLAAIQNLFARGEQGGYWPADPAYLYEDSAGTISASLDGVVGLLTNAVTGYPNAIQATTANKPYLRRTPVSNKYWLDSNTYTGALTATFASALGSACTIATVGEEGVTIAENQTITTTYNLTPPYGYNGGVLIINRALTASEKALVTRTLKRNAPYYPSIVDARLQMRGYAPNNENTVDTSIITDFYAAWYGCSGLTSFPLINTAAGTNFYAAWWGCSSLTSFPLINTAAGTNFYGAWFGCSGLTSFPLINTAAGTNFYYAWVGCSGLTSFPLINTAAGTNFYAAWYGCSGLTSFPLINTAAGTNFYAAWWGCSSLTSFPLINTAAGTNFSNAWYGCSSLTSFPLINTAAGTSFSAAWWGCSGLTSFPLINTAAGTNFDFAWYGCSSLTSFPLINTAAGTGFYATWYNCSGLTSFPLINTAAGTNFHAAWNGCSSLTSFPLINTAAGTDFSYAWAGCSGLTSFPLINTAAGTSFSVAWYGCGLTSFPANFFDSWTGVPIADCFSLTWDSCINLTLASVQNIVVSLVVSGKSAPATGTDISLDGAPTLVAIQADTTVMTAVATLKSRNWTPKYKGTAL